MLANHRGAIDQIQVAAAKVERTLLMIPGPTAITAEVLAAGARPVLSHSDPRLRGFVAESLARLRSLFGAPAAQPIIAAGSGTLAMEIGLANLALSGVAHAHQIDTGDNRGVDVAMAARGDTPGDDLGAA